MSREDRFHEGLNLGWKHKDFLEGETISNDGSNGFSAVLLYLYGLSCGEKNSKTNFYNRCLESSVYGDRPEHGPRGCLINYLKDEAEHGYKYGKEEKK